MRYRRRWARGAEVLFEATSIELLESRDSDGDDWFKLQGTTSEPRPFHWRHPLSSWRRRWTIASEMEDETNVERVAEVVAARTGLALRRERSL